MGTTDSKVESVNDMLLRNAFQDYEADQCKITDAMDYSRDKVNEAKDRYDSTNNFWGKLTGSFYRANANLDSTIENEKPIRDRLQEQLDERTATMVERAHSIEEHGGSIPEGIELD